MRISLLLSILLLGMPALSQEAIPVGTILPVRLNSTVNSNKMRVGQMISATLMQDVPLPGNRKVRSGTKVLGRIDAVKSVNQGGAEVALRFDTIVVGKRRIGITTDLRALASMMDVEEAQVPPTGPDRGTSEFEWTTEQVGGETVYHGGGPVTHGSSIIGKSVRGGMLVPVVAVAGCRGDAGDNGRPQALWVFSSDACGLYDLPNLKLVHAGRSTPEGEIQVEALSGPVKIRAGSGMLLRTTASK